MPTSEHHALHQRQQHGPLHLLQRHGMTGGDAASIHHASGHPRPESPVEIMLCVLARAVVHTHSLLEDLMNQLDDVKAAQADDEAAAAAVAQRVSADLGELHAKLQALQDQINQGQTVDLTDVLAHARSLKGTLDSIDAPPVEGSDAEEATEDAATEAAEDAPPAEPPAGDQPPADPGAPAPGGDVPGDPAQAGQQDPGSAPPA